jgi:hypothetical protein
MTSNTLARTAGRCRGIPAVLVNLYRLGVMVCQNVSKLGEICLFFAAGGLDCRTHFDPNCHPPAAGGPLNSAHRSGGSAMTKATLSRRRTRRRHVREKATIDHLVRAVYSKTVERGTMHSAVTASGLSVEEQIRKQWHPGLGGLALF